MTGAFLQKQISKSQQLTYNMMLKIGERRELISTNTGFHSYANDLVQYLFRGLIELQREP